MSRDQIIEKRIAAALPMYRPLMRRAYAGDSSPREAIKAFCLHCTGYERQAIANCSAGGCPLYVLRPYQKGGEE